MNIKEIWKPIINYEGKYEVSSLGRVRSIDHYCENKFAKWYQKGKILKQYPQASGYMNVTLSDGNNKASQYRVHRLVAQAFIPNPDNLPQVNHKDENKQNNRVENLEWCTVKHNLNYGHHIQNVRSSWMARSDYKKIAINNGKKASKSVVQLTLNGKVVNSYPSQSEAARKTGFKQGSISNACCGRLKTYKGYVWKFI